MNKELSPKWITNEYKLKPQINVEILPGIIKSGNYEKYICKLLSESTDIFASANFNRNEKQSQGECDLIDSKTGEKYEIKLAFSNNDGKMIGKNETTENDIICWVHKYLSAANTDRDYSANLSAIKEDEFFVKLQTVVNKIEDDENAIIYIPFPITLADEQSAYTKDANILHLDYLYFVYKMIKKEKIYKGFLNNKKLFFVYPTIDQKMVIRDIADNKIEFIQDDDICNICGIGKL